MPAWVVYIVDIAIREDDARERAAVEDGVEVEVYGRYGGDGEEEAEDIVEESL